MAHRCGVDTEAPKQVATPCLPLGSPALLRAQPSVWAADSATLAGNAGISICSLPLLCDPKMLKSSMATRWGICSAGKISHDFLVALRTLPSADHQVGSLGLEGAGGGEDGGVTLHDECSPLLSPVALKALHHQMWQERPLFSLFREEFHLLDS